MATIFGWRDAGRLRRIPRTALIVVGLVLVVLFVAVGAVLCRRHRDYGAFFPGRTPVKLTYCGGRGYRRGGPATPAVARPAGGSLVTVGHTPGDAAMFAPTGLAVVGGRTMCPTVLWVADPDAAHLLSYALSGAP